jgi:hypothetical protein
MPEHFKEEWKGGIKTEKNIFCSFYVEHFGFFSMPVPGLEIWRQTLIGFFDGSPEYAGYGL